MKRRTFDLLVSMGGLLLAVTLAIAGLVFKTNADFAKDNVREQLSAQNISFPPPAALSDEERQHQGVVRYAGQKVTDGEMAEVYANEYIGTHLKGIAGGKTYSEVSAIARESPNDQALAGQKETLFRGETLRGLLLTTYAFWTLGEKASQAAVVFGFAALLLFVGSVAGFAHYSATSKREQISF